MTNTNTPTANAEANGGSPTNGETEHNVRPIYVDAPGMTLSHWDFTAPTYSGKRVFEVTAHFIQSVSVTERIINDDTLPVTEIMFRVGSGNRDNAVLKLFGMTRLDLVRALLAE